MQTVHLIAKKRQGLQHSAEELRYLLEHYQQGSLPDYQMAAWLMAVCWQGMTLEETSILTELMAASGERLDLSEFAHSVDKHSTGGVGDKTSLVVAPWLAACGATVAKMSGRGLGHTGGTIDKLEAIPGFRTELSDAEFLTQARDIGVVIVGQSKDLAPADGLIYALRDATATVESLPLIASSIMSKKLASGAKTIVLDVKVGSGAFMETLEAARALAKTMLAIGKRTGRQVQALLSNMQQPLGYAIGGALEVQEAIACLRGQGPEDLQQLCSDLVAMALQASGVACSPQAQQDVLVSGQAYAKFEAWVAAQGGEVAALDKLELAGERYSYRASTSGYVARLDARSLGQAVKALGGGRLRKGDAIDLGVGIMLEAKIGTPLQAGDALLSLYHRPGQDLSEALALLDDAVSIAENPPETPPLLFERLQ